MGISATCGNLHGDFLDQWFLPATYEHVTDSDEFYRACAAANQEVMDAFADTIRAGVDVIYVPGNHDMTLSNEVLSDIIPGIRQARDVRGLGRYRTGKRAEVVIEHCHRYESFCAPDMFSNKDYVSYGEPILPPGYFFALIGVQGFAEGKPDVHKKIDEIPMPDKSDSDQLQAYAYYEEYDGYDKKKIYVNEGTWIDHNTDDPENTATFAEIISDSDDTKVFLKKCIGDGRLEDIVDVKNKYVTD